jgi:hypothetical protein
MLQEFIAVQSDVNLAVNQSADSANKAAQAARDYADGVKSAFCSVVTELQLEVNAHREDVLQHQGKIERLFESQADRFDHRLDNLDAAFSALANRDWHRRLFRELGEAFEALAKPVDEGQGIANGGAWIQEAKSWRGKLDQWLVIADYYCVGTANRVLTLPEHVYDSDHWNFDEKALTATQVHRFKEVAIWFHNAEEAKPKVDGAFVRALMNPSRHGRVDAPPKMKLGDAGGEE